MSLSYTERAGARLGDFRYKGTQIDRSKCSRKKPLEVLCLGRERTGTASIREALFQLGYSHVYHYASVIHENPRDSETWREAFRAKYSHKGTFGKEQWDKLLGHCMAVTDVPCALFGPELMSAYPDACVILSVRDSPQAWQKSVLSTVWRAYEFLGQLQEPTSNLLVRLYRHLLPATPTAPMDALYWRALGYAQNPDGLPALYEAHNQEILRTADSMGREALVFNVKQGWEPLCKFLGKEVPNTPFPNVNDKTMFEGSLDLYKKIMLGSAALWGLVYVSSATAICAALWWIAQH